jgi:hypothetical protein
MVVTEIWLTDESVSVRVRATNYQEDGMSVQTATKLQTSARADEAGRMWVFIADDIAHELKNWTRAGWTEISGVAHGYSRDAHIGTRVGDLLAELYEACKAAGDSYAFIAGESFEPMSRDADYSLLVSTCGVTRSYTNPSSFHIEG